MKAAKLLQKAMQSPQNLRFSKLLSLAQAFGYTLDRVRGSHHILVHEAADRVLNFQKVGGKTKPYQARQFLRDIKEFILGLKS